MQAQLLHQWEAGPSNQSRQEGMRHSVTSSPPLSVAQLNQPNQALLAEFRRKADANPDNTPLTKDYFCDVLVELADWLKQQPHYPALRSLLDLVGFVCNDKQLYDLGFIRTLVNNFTSSGAAPVNLGKPNLLGQTFRLDLALRHIIEALNLSRYEPRITLQPSFASRQDERLLHTFHLDLLRQDTIDRRTVSNNVSGLKHFHVWLHQQTALRKSIPHGLDSLEKLRDHPDENEVKEVIASFRSDPGTTRGIGKQAYTAVMKFRRLMQQPPAQATSGLGTQPTLQQLPAQLDQPANLAPLHSPSLTEPTFTEEEIDWLSKMLEGGSGEQHGASSSILHTQAPEATHLGAQPHGVRRPAHWSQDEPRAVRPRLDPAQPEQPANLAPLHNPSLTEPTFIDGLTEPTFIDGLTEPTFIDGLTDPTSTIDEEIAFFNRIFR